MDIAVFEHDFQIAEVIDDLFGVVGVVGDVGDGLDHFLEVRFVADQSDEMVDEPLDLHCGD
jgi:hypothetical protein